jgi:bacillithiol system protein YtxJ
MKHWKMLTAEEQLNAIIEDSYQRPQLIFKDSTSCGISAHAKEKLAEGTDRLIELATCYYLDLLQYRSISNRVAQLLEVTHQSPQVIVLKDGRAVYHVSHHAIQPADLLRHM